MVDFTEIRWQLEQRKRELALGVGGLLLILAITAVIWWFMVASSKIVLG